MPDEVLDAPDFIGRREQFWTAALYDARHGTNAVATAILDGDIVGVAMAGPARAECAGWEKQLYVLYTYASVYGQGAGAELLRAVIGPEDSVALWVADPNPRAQAFYRKHGFTVDGASKVEDGIREVRMTRLPSGFSRQVTRT
jgi:GNAT superfamily N-acetyltransferase